MKRSDGVTIIEAVQTLKQLGFESIGRQTLRQYEFAGLINPDRKKNKYRIYNYEQIDRLELILTMRDLNFSIPEIRQIFEYWDKINAMCVDVCQNVSKKGTLDSEMERKAQIVKDAYDEQITFLREKIMAKIQDSIAILELRIDKQKQKIARLQKSSAMIDDILSLAAKPE